MNKERLLKLADFLDTVPDEKFNMNAWICVGDDEDNDQGHVLSSDLLVMESKVCGCAIGWATTIPEFKEQEFTFDQGADIMYKDASGSTRFGFDAVSFFFDIHPADTQDLFGITEFEEQPTPSEKAEQIREFVYAKTKQHQV